QRRSIPGGAVEPPEAHVASLLPTSERGRQVHVVAFSVEAVTPCAFTLGALAGEVRPVGGPGGAPAVARIGGLDGAPLKPRARWEEHAAAARPGAGRALTGSGAATNRR